jgi:hypothetical protein
MERGVDEHTCLTPTQVYEGAHPSYRPLLCHLSAFLQRAQALPTYTHRCKLDSERGAIPCPRRLQRLQSRVDGVSVQFELVQTRRRVPAKTAAVLQCPAEFSSTSGTLSALLYVVAAEQVSRDCLGCRSNWQEAHWARFDAFS